MAQYLVVTGDNPNFATQVEAKNISQAVESLGLKPGEKATIYRLAAPPFDVEVREERRRVVEVLKQPSGDKENK